MKSQLLQLNMSSMTTGDVELEDIFDTVESTVCDTD